MFELEGFKMLKEIEGFEKVAEPVDFVNDGSDPQTSPSGSDFFPIVTKIHRGILDRDRPHFSQVEQSLKLMKRGEVFEAEEGNDGKTSQDLLFEPIEFQLLELTLNAGE